MSDAADIFARLDLAPHCEGGWRLVAPAPAGWAPNLISGETV
jgi:hypothetical protein